MFAQTFARKTTQQLLPLALGALSLLPTQALAQEANANPCISDNNISTCASDLALDTPAIGLGTAPNNDNILSSHPTPPPFYSDNHLETITTQINQEPLLQASNPTCQPLDPYTASCAPTITYRF